MSQRTGFKQEMAKPDDRKTIERLESEVAFLKDKQKTLNADLQTMQADKEYWMNR